RLKQVDFNGKENFSHVIEIGLENNSNLNTISTSPNPFTHDFVITTNIKSATDILLQVYDVNGKLVHENILKNTAGVNTNGITEMSEMPSGFYYLKMTIDGEIVTKKLVKVN
ncbi:MAG: T9SS type A sorting domain-containing protein, partial [Bacteroidota bacterium]